LREGALDPVDVEGFERREDPIRRTREDSDVVPARISAAIA
jgi:hypothetical protein